MLGKRKLYGKSVKPFGANKVGLGSPVVNRKVKVNSMPRIDVTK